MNIDTIGVAPLSINNATHQENGSVGDEFGYLWVQCLPEHHIDTVFHKFKGEFGFTLGCLSRPIIPSISEKSPFQLCKYSGFEYFVFPNEHKSGSNEWEVMRHYLFIKMFW